MSENLKQVSLQEYINNIYLEIPDSKKFQVAGGFEIPNGINLENLLASNILKRLCSIAENNLVVISEMGNGSDYSTSYDISFDDFNLKDHIPDISSSTGVDDTCFVVGNNVEHLEKTGRTNIIGVDGINFASIHLSGDGPNGTGETIPTFISNQLIKSQVTPADNISVICGDTNITHDKCSKLGLRLNDIGKEIALGLDQYFGGSWIVVMSNYKVDKIRKGFLLINQQVKKSQTDASKNPEEDGSIIGIKVSDSNGERPDETFIQNLPQQYRCYTSTEVLAEGQQDLGGVIFNFTEPVLDENNLYVNPIFLDHSVLQLSSKLLNILFHKNFKFNLISLNMGSTINSGKKNWNTEFINFYTTIKEADKNLYDMLKAKNPSLPEYENIVGSIVKNEIFYDPLLTEEKTLISNLMNEIQEQNQQSLGGSRKRYRNKSRKYKKRTRKCKKRTRKCKKRTRKYKR